MYLRLMCLFMLLRKIDNLLLVVEAVSLFIFRPILQSSTQSNIFGQ